MTAHDACPGLSAVQRDILTVLNGSTLQDTAIQALLEDYYDANLEYDRLATLLAELVEMGLITRVERDHRAVAYRLTAARRRRVQRHAAWLRAETASRSDEDERADDKLGTSSASPPTTNGNRVPDGGVVDGDDVNEDSDDCRAVCAERECPFDNAYETHAAASQAALEHTRETGHIVGVAEDPAALVRGVAIEGDTMQDIVAALTPDTPTDGDDTCACDHGGEQRAE